MMYEEPEATENDSSPRSVGAWGYAPIEKDFYFNEA